LSPDWIEGRFEGIYSGPRRPPLDADARDSTTLLAVESSTLRRFEFEIQSGQLRDFEPCLAPDAETFADVPTIRQRRVKRVRLTDADGPDCARETSLFDVHIRDWELKYPAEAGDRAYGTIVGTLRARRRPVVAAPFEAIEQTAVTREPDPVSEASSDAVEPAVVRPEQVGSKTWKREAPVEILESHGWALVLALVAGIFAAIVYACGFGSGVLWGLPVEGVLALLWLTRGGRLGGTARWLGASLLLLQVLVLWTPLSIAWHSGCWLPLSIWTLLGVALPMAFAALLGSRGGLWATAAVWTFVHCVGCMGPASTSCGAALASDSSVQSAQSLQADSPTAQRPRSRTDAGGRRPVMPLASGALGAAASIDGAGGSRRSAPGGLASSEGTPRETRGEASQADRVAAIGGSPSSSLPSSSSSSDPDQPSGAQAEAGPIGAHRRSQVDGGWLSPEHRQAPRSQSRISIEQANRTPALFFESGGARRVYVPTDPIFEDGSSIPRRDAPLVLARVAALLSLPASPPPVVLEVHSDSAGAEDSQIELSRRRAAVVRGWLIDRGHIAPDRFEMKPIGGRRPLVPPDGDFAAQQPNRRIEIRLREER
jgi:outer membrane protein OmpA-like peptidoglycan-associated protein